jgi:hypothetical protein
MASKPQKNYDLIVFSTLTLLTSVIWVTTEVYRNLRKVTIPANIAAYTVPLNPTLDTNTLDQLQQKVVITQSQPTPVIPTATPESTPSASP